MKHGYKFFIFYFLFFLVGFFSFSATIPTVTTTYSKPFFENKDTIIYTIKVENLTSQDINNYTIENLILDTDFFTNINITGDGFSNGSTLGTFSTSGNFLATHVNIPTGGYVQYKLEAALKSSTIVPVTVTTTLYNEINTLVTTSTTTITPVIYNYEITKTASGSTYNYNGNIVYTVTITNNHSSMPLSNISVQDLLSTLNATSLSGEVSPAFDMSNVTITASGTNGSYPGIFSTTGDLNVTNATIAPGSNVKYIITAKVNSNIIGNITNTATIVDKIGGTKSSSPLTISQVQPTTTISKTQVSNSPYAPEGAISYLLTVKNTGQGIANNRTVRDLLGNINVNLSSDNSISNDASDILGSPFSSISITATLGTGSTKSYSDLINSGGFSNNPNLIDTNVTLYPGESINYSITAITSSYAISDILNTASMTNNNNNSTISSSVTTISNPVIAPNSPLIKRVKTTSSPQYRPGDFIEYEILVSNLDSSHFANNITIIDILSNIKATTNLGALTSAFESWTLSVSNSTGKGTKPGIFNYDVPTTDDINIIADVGPGGTITYKLIAKVKENITGLILDNTSIANDNVKESGSGVKMAEATLSIGKNVNTTEYISGSPLIYTIEISNTGDGTAVNVPIADLLSTIKTQHSTGNLGSAFDSWSITASIFDKNGVLLSNPGVTSSGINGTLTADLNTNITIAPSESLVFTINAIVHPLAKGKIINHATVNNNLYSDKGATTKTSLVSIFKSSDMASYPVAGKNKVTYTITVSNSANNGIALNVPVVDNISQIQGELLEPLGSKVNVFSDWTISAVTSGIGTTSGSFSNNQDLNTTVNIAPGGFVKYTIIGTLNSNDTQIVYGNFSNTVTSSGLSATTTTVPKSPNLSISKITREKDYDSDNGQVTYEILINNSGDGYANDAIITDTLSSVISANGNKLKSWTITAITSGVGTTSGNFSANTDINTKVDIAPGGSVKYIISAKLDEDTSGDIINTAKVYDSQSGNNYTASASISDKKNHTLFIKKSSKDIYYSPGKIFTYYIDVINNSANSVSNITITDKIKDIKGKLANNGSNSPVDLLDQSIFSSWEIYKDGILLSQNSDLNDLIPTLSTGKSVRYEIRALVKENAVEPKIQNTATLYDKNGKSLGSSLIENNIINLWGSIEHSVNKTNYNPGVDTLVYTITVSSGPNGYYNNVNLNELISNISVELIDGSFGNPFLNPDTNTLNFSVIQDNSSIINPGTTTIPIANNSNITGIVDVKPGDKLVYLITGTVRKDAVGIIDFNSIKTYPYKPNLHLNKQVTQKSYYPGEKISYNITITNNSSGNAKDYHIYDDLNGITVLDSDGNVVPAFTSFKFSKVDTLGYKADPGLYSDNNNLDTLIDIPANGGKITYNIDAIVTPKAVGPINNLLDVEDDSVSATIKSGLDKASLEKKLVRLYDTNGSLFPLTYTQYTPGGYIEYDIVVKNLGYGILANKQLTDAISDVKTQYFDGSFGPAFDSWTVSVKERDALVSTNPGSFSNNSSINTNIDIGPRGYITYTVKAKISEKAVGDILNEVFLDSLNSSVTTSSLPPSITHTKVAKNTSNINISSFYPGQTVVYFVTLSNVGGGISYNNSFTDTLSTILSEVAETGSNGTTPKENPFSSWDITVNKSSETATTISNNYSGGINLSGSSGDIDLSSLSIAPKGSITFVITARIKDNVIGSILNTSKFISSSGAVDTKTVNLNSTQSSITKTKTISKLNGANYVNGMTYRPGDSIEYLITINNTALGFSNNLSIFDDLDSVTSILNTGTSAPSIENVNITATLTDSRTYLRTPPAQNARLINSSADIPPNGKIVFTIRGNIKNTSMGTISGNSVKVGSNTVTTPTILPKPAIITAKKELIAPTGLYYKPNDIFNYLITIENSGEGYGVNIPIKDEISKIKTTLIGGIQGPAFTSWSITKTLIEGNGVTTNTDVSQNNSDINITNANIAPGAKIIYNIQATVNPKAIGDISNVAYVNNIAIPSPTRTLEKALVSLIKTPKNTTYLPDGEIVFYLDIINNSNTTAANILLTDDIKNIVTNLSTNSNGSALKNNFTYSTSIIGDSQNTFIGPLTSGNSISNARLDIPPNTTVRVTVNGSSVSNAVGIITNSASINYNNTTYTSSASVSPVIATIDNIEISKEVSNSSYAPGTPVLYTLLFKNNGPGYATGIEITDFINNIQTSSINGGTVPAFDSYSIVSKSVSSPNNKITDISNSSGYDTFLNIAPNSTITIVIKGIVNPLAAGSIDNIVTANYNNLTLSSNVEVTPLPSILNIKKTVNKLIYESEDTLTYTLEIENLGQGPALGVVVKDSISEIQSSFIGGNIDFVFDPSTINITRKKGSLDATVIPGSDLNDIINIPSILNTGENKVIYTITGKIKPSVNGQIKNSAFINGNPSNEVTSEPKIANINFLKTIAKDNFEPGKKILYSFTIENTENSPANNMTLIDNIKDIMASSSDFSLIPAFKSWKIVSISDSSGGDSILTSLVPGINVLSNSDNIKIIGDIAPKSIIKIEIECNVNDNVAGNIENIASVLYNGISNSSSTVSIPEKANINLEKKILTINNTSYTNNSTYTPGSTVEYEVKVSNTGLGFAREILISDYISNIAAETSNGNLAPAFSSWRYDIVSDSNLNIIQNRPSNNENLNTKLTLAPNSSVTFNIKGDINLLALGDISENIVTVAPTTETNGAPNGLSAKTNAIPPGIATLKTNKEIIQGTNYISGEEIIYRISLENNSSVFAKNIEIKDFLSSIQSTSVGGSLTQAFSSWNIVIDSTSPNTHIVRNFGPNEDINDIATIAPNSSITYTITGKINSNIIGDIVNEAVITYDNTSYTHSVVSTLDKVPLNNISVTKVSNVEYYSPGADITYNILIENKSNNIITGFKIKDEISKILSTSADGTLKPTFSNWTINSTINGNIDSSNISSIPSTGDIDSIIDIGKLSSILITITGKSDSLSIGDITNYAYWSYNTSENNEVKSTILPEIGDVSIIKSVNSQSYEIGDTLIYKITISNNGTGFAKNILLVDAIDSIVTNVSNSTSQGKAFKSWSVISKNHSVNSSVVNEDLSKGYSASLNIYPNESVDIEIGATLNDDVLGLITNEASIEYNSIISNADVSVKSKDIHLSDLLITKDVNSSEYIPNDSITYSIKVKNISNNWAHNVNLQDNLNEIESEVMGSNTIKGKAFLFDINNDLNVTFDLAPKSEIEYTLSGVVSPNLVGSIENSAKVVFNNNLLESNVVTTNPIIPNLIFTKETLNSEYSPGKPITYKLTLKNDTLYNISGVSLTDYIRDITIKNYENIPIPAFESWEFTTAYNNSFTTIYSPPINNENIDTKIDLGAKDELTFTIIAKTDKDDFENITNKATATIPKNNQLDEVINGEVTSIINPYSLEIKMTQSDTTYIPGKDIQYDIIIKNKSESPALNINLSHLIKDTIGDFIDGTKSKIFTQWEYEIINSEGVITPISLISNEDINNKLFLDAEGAITIRVKGEVDSKLIGEIRLNSSLSDSYLGKNILLSNDVIFNPVKPNIVINKSSEVRTNSLGVQDAIIYTITLENDGNGNDINILFTDNLSKIISENGYKAFDSWSISYSEYGNKYNNNLSTVDSKDIEHEVILQSNKQNKLVYTITAILNKKAFGNISNTATVKDSFGNISNSTVENQIKDSHGVLNLYKKAFKSAIRVGEAVEYEILVKNPKDISYEDIVIVDRIPAGFRYLDNSATLTLFDKNGKNYKSFSTTPVLSGKNLNFEPITISENGSFSIRYLLKPSIGTTMGKYENRAYATVNGYLVSNIDKATVEIVGDPLMDTASIIGKVFHDINGDNYQNSPEANNIKIDIKIDKNKFIPNSGVILTKNGQNKLTDSELVGHKGIHIKSLKGIDQRRKNLENKIIIKYKSYSDNFSPLKLLTAEGTNIIINDKGEHSLIKSSRVKRGINSQNIGISQNIYLDSKTSIYTHELIVENNAFYEHGIPGVRIFTTDGIIVETDAYGRYQIPDQWVFNKKGENVVIKVDENSLPKGMIITSENPYVQRISSKVLNQFNFSVQKKEKKESD